MTWRRRKVGTAGARRGRQVADRPDGRPLPPLSRRPAAYAYYARRSAPAANTGRGGGAERLAAEGAPGRARAYRRRLLFTAGAVLGAATLVYALILNPVPAVMLEGSGRQPASGPINQAAYQRAAVGLLSSSILNRTKLTLDQSAVDQTLISHFPEVARAWLSWPLLGHKLTLHIVTHRPAFRLITATGRSYVLDKDGVALYSTTAASAVSQTLVPLNDQSGLPITPGRSALPYSSAAFIQTVLAQLAAAKVAYASLVLPPASSQLEVHLSGQPYFIKFNFQDAPLQQVGAYLAVRQQLAVQHIVPAQYVDVRLPGRVYYK